MTKILLLAIAFAAGIWLLRSQLRRSLREDRDAPASADRQAEDMVACARCGLHLPRGESVVSGTRYFCSVDHEREFREAR